ncbi:LysR substrate-binding domain-containing protein [Pollutimonas harenae]|uniref:LysR family transcriptional regulator n=1 Tax=Pollutimonas harenae TaxID=657015 RepID=A0A853H8N2_9BURK|nr:LysR substrate-binding domain-containing protein [Pollutimonas harenae]NYT86823.1 LysR family transcriptional regulator [Pollutimonas harenae]TEA71468.1 LysR family transcriptional regulator [Pollutimonas harenae]
MLGISLKQLEVFVAIASAGTVRAAAERLFVTQPAVSMALAELERQLETQLFDRERGRLRLSSRGKEVLPMAQEVIERVQEMLRQTNQQPKELTGDLHVGASNTIGNYLAGELLGPFIAQHPQVSLQVSVENTDAITMALLEHRIDIGCVEGPVNHPQLEVLHWRDDALVVCAAPAHPLAQQSTLKPRHFKGAKWILRERGSAMRVQAEHVLNSLPPGQILLELGQVEAIKQAVIAGLGIACLPYAAAIESMSTGRLKVLDTPFLDLQRRLSLVLHKSRYRGALIDAFVASLSETSDSMMSKEASKPQPQTGQPQ